MNVNRLKGKMRECNITYKRAAEELGITTGTFSNKMNNRCNSDFRLTELEKLGDLLNLSRNERADIFLS